MDKKQEALDRIKAAEREIAEAKRIIGAEDKIDLRDEWIGKVGFISDAKQDLRESYMGVLQKIVSGDLPFIVNGTPWRYFRPATPEELGFTEYEEMRDFIERMTMVDPSHPDRLGWSWESLVEEARRILIINTEPQPHNHSTKRSG